MIERKRGFLKGSYTIEAALLFPMILFILLLLFYFSIFLFNKVSFQAYSIRGAMQIHYMPGETNERIRKKSEQVLSEGISKSSVGIKEAQTIVKVGKNGSETETLGEMEVISFLPIKVDSRIWCLREGWQTDRMNPAEVFATTRKLFLYSELLKELMEGKEE